MDALLWLAVSIAILLFSIPIGFVSNDGLGYSRSFAAGSWQVNPNPILFEPLGAYGGCDYLIGRMRTRSELSSTTIRAPEIRIRHEPRR